MSYLKLLCRMYIYVYIYSTSDQPGFSPASSRCIPSFAIAHWQHFSCKWLASGGYLAGYNTIVVSAQDCLLWILSMHRFTTGHVALKEQSVPWAIGHLERYLEENYWLLVWSLHIHFSMCVLPPVSLMTYIHTIDHTHTYPATTARRLYRPCTCIVNVSNGLFAGSQKSISKDTSNWGILVHPFCFP